MKLVFLVLSSFMALSCFGQSLPFTFEGDIATSDFVDFDGGTATVISNPQSNGINTSDNVAQIVRDGGQNWGGSKIELAANLNFENNNSIKLKVYTSAPAGTQVKMKLESSTGAVERDAVTQTTGEWEELTWDFTSVTADFNTIVFMFDFGNVGDGTAASTFLFDDVEQFFGGYQIDLPVSFEEADVNYTLTDFGGNSSSLVTDPTNANNTVAKVIKTDNAETWAGTTIGTNSGFQTYIPLTLEKSTMSVYVWSPKAGTPVRLKVEDANDNTHTCETQTNTTKDGDWEVLQFDFNNEATGTAELEFGLNNGWKYNMASIFFNFDVDGATAGEQTYYFDDVTFGELIVGFNEKHKELNIQAFPTQSHLGWNVVSNVELIQKIEIFTLSGKLVQTINPNVNSLFIDASTFNKGTYIAQISSHSDMKSIRLVKE
ncbi:MAG: T9SS type A sorting domain-containing protein [Bacteroidia bacterium]